MKKWMLGWMTLICCLVFSVSSFAITKVITVIRSTEPAHVEATMHVMKKALQNHDNVTILFDDKAVKLLDTREEPLQLKNGRTLHQEIQDFIKAGAIVKACAKCISRQPDLLPKDMVKGVGVSKGEEEGGTKKVSLDYYYK